jgi:hypothetical protein
MNRIRTLLPVLLVIIVAGGAIWWLSQSDSTPQSSNLTTQVQQGPFSIQVTATGELQAKRSVKIRGPQGMRSAQIYQTTISDMVAEGTIVQEGEYVATLDRTELDTKMKEAMTEIEKIETQLEQAKIDTALELRSLRDQLINLRFGMEEKKLQVEQSRYEPQMVIQQAEIELERSERDFNQLEQKYQLTRIKSEAQISEILASLKQNQLKLQQLQDLASSFMVNAPKDGMVIYARNWNGKVGPGSQISTWDPVVAELPDLTDMISKTYVNEVDISKVQKGQPVRVQVDAFPDNAYTGTVIQVANVGEQLSGYDAKVFEVVVQLTQTDSILRPAMTTSNEILTYLFDNEVYIPLESLHNDSISYVYRQEGARLFRQEIVTGESNDNQIIVELGLEPGQEILLTVPEDAEKIPLELLPAEEKEAAAKQLASDREIRRQEAQKRAKEIKTDQIQTDRGGGRTFIMFN